MSLQSSLLSILVKQMSNILHHVTMLRNNYMCGALHAVHLYLVLMHVLSEIRTNVVMLGTIKINLVGIVQNNVKCSSESQKQLSITVSIYLQRTTIKRKTHLKTLRILHVNWY